MTYEAREKRILEKYNECREKKARLTERMNMLLENMRSEYNVGSYEELEQLRDKTEKQLEGMEKRIEPLLCSVEEALGI